MAKEIGTIGYTDDSLQRVHLWQYGEATRLNALLNAGIDFANIYIRDFWETWRKTLFDIKTADVNGLITWGSLLGVSRRLTTDEGDAIELDIANDEDDRELYRRMLTARFFIFSRQGTIPDINQYLQTVFPGKIIWVRDNYDMTVSIIAYISMTEKEKAILLSPDFLPIPCGVKRNIYIYDPNDILLGFEGSELDTLDNGVFISFR